LKKVASYSLLFLIFLSIFAFAQKKNTTLQLKEESIMQTIKNNFKVNDNQIIEGKWIDPTSKSIVLIYKQKDKFFGKVLSSGNEDEDKKMQDKTIYVLSEFEQKTENEFCCGTIFLPRRKMTVTGTLTLIDENKLEVKGSYGIFSHQIIWEKISS
jgi:uncharacterized protein (DUF2147 family)